MTGQRQLGQEMTIFIDTPTPGRMKIEFDIPDIPLDPRGEDVIERMKKILEELEIARSMRILETMGCMEAICLPKEVVSDQLNPRLLEELIAQKCAVAICIDYKGLIEITLEELVSAIGPHQRVLNSLKCEDSVCLPEEYQEQDIFWLRPTDIFGPSCVDAICTEENNVDPAEDEEIPTPELEQKVEEADEEVAEAVEVLEETKKEVAQAADALSEAEAEGASDGELEVLRENLATKQKELETAQTVVDAAATKSADLHSQLNARQGKEWDGETIFVGGKSQELSTFLFGQGNKGTDPDTGEEKYMVAIDHSDGGKSMLTFDSEGAMIEYYDGDGEKGFAYSERLDGVSDGKFEVTSTVSAWIGQWYRPEDGDVLRPVNRSADLLEGILLP